MVGQAHWLTGIALLLGALLVVGLPLLLSRLQPRFRGVQCDVLCPKSKRLAHVELAQSLPTLHFTGVYRCSEFVDPTRVRCERGCAREANRRG